MEIDITKLKLGKLECNDCIHSEMCKWADEIIKTTIKLSNTDVFNNEFPIEVTFKCKRYVKKEPKWYTY